MRIYIPIVVLIVILAGYSWAWQRSAAEVRTELTQWVEDERAEGRIAEYSSFRVRGFPYRMQIEITEPRLGDERLGWSWEAEKITGFVLPYRLSHAVLVIEGEQRFEFLRLDRREVIVGQAEDQRASLVLARRGLERFALDASGIDMTREIFLTDRPGAPERVERISVGQLNAHTQRVRDNSGLPNNGQHHAIVVEAFDITWNDHPYEGLGSDIAFVLARILAAGLPEETALGPELLSQWSDNGGILFLDEAAIRWGEIEVAGTGVFELDDAHRPEGEMTIFISGYDRAIDALVAGGALDPEYAEISKTVLDVVAALGGDPDGRIRAPLRLEDGTVFLGSAEMMELEPLY